MLLRTFKTLRRCIGRGCRAAGLLVSMSAGPCPAAEPIGPAVDTRTQEIQRQANAPIRNLTPAPIISNWGPRLGNVDHGIVTIDGTGFDPATVRVRFGGDDLELLDKRLSRVVARLPDRSAGSYATAVLTVGNVGGEVRVLSNSYEIRPRWPPVAPRFMDGEIDATVGAVNEGNTWYSKAYRLRFLDMPGDEIVGIEPINSHSGACAFASSRVPITVANTGIAPYTTVYSASISPTRPIRIADDPSTFESGGRGRQEIHFRRFWLSTYKSNAGEHCDQVRVRLHVRYDDEPADVRPIEMTIRGIPSPATRRLLIVSDTHAMLTSKLFRIEPNIFNTPFSCRYEVGNSSGAFRQALDWIVTGSNCEHVIFFNDLAWDNSVKFVAWNWVGPNFPGTAAGEDAPRCKLKQSDPQFPRMKMFMGWTRIEESYPRGDFIRTILMECSSINTRGAKSTPNQVTALLQSIVLDVPAEATSWRVALNAQAR
jgi:hypothetical protein